MTAKDTDHESELEQVSDNVILLIVSLYAAAFVVFGFLVDDPRRRRPGTHRHHDVAGHPAHRLFRRSGGIGAGCVNAGLLTLCACFVYYKARARITGAAVACLFLVPRLRALRQEPPERLVHRDRGPAVFLVQG